jgi:hypothetical protein
MYLGPTSKLHLGSLSTVRSCFDHAVFRRTRYSELELLYGDVDAHFKLSALDALRVEFVLGYLATCHLSRQALNTPYDMHYKINMRRM